MNEKGAALTTSTIRHAPKAPPRTKFLGLRAAAKGGIGTPYVLVVQPLVGMYSVLLGNIR